MRINWKVRLQHIPFLLGLFSLLLLLAQQVAAIFGYDFTGVMSEQMSSILNTVLSILVLMGGSLLIQPHGGAPVIVNVP